VGSLLGDGGVPTLVDSYLQKVLVTGLSPAEVYNRNTGVSTLTGAMIIPRTGHQATPLPSGDVLVSGGMDANHQLVGSAELYHPGDGTWTLTGAMNSPPEWTHSNTASHGQGACRGWLDHGGRTVRPGDSGLDAHSAKYCWRGSECPPPGWQGARRRHDVERYSQSDL
jgi:hypothetical protein